MKTVILTGMMGSGKTTCGKRLAKQLQREFIDTDAVIVERAGKPISEIFAQEGEKAFRDLETRISQELAGREDLVIATGGGLILRQENVDALKENGVFVFLNRPADLIFDSTSMQGRPLAQSGKEAFLNTFAAREPWYRQTADVEICDFSSVTATVDEIMRKVEKLL